MRLDYTKTALLALERVPSPIRKAFYKQASFLLQNLHHPSLRAKKYSETSRGHQDQHIFVQSHFWFT
jgi:mRNA-degrading endonuclease RelE of RelBE toxin-antitoxin system